MAADSGMPEAQLSTLSVTPAGALHSQVRMWRTGPTGSAMGFAVFRIAHDGSSCRRVTAVLPLPHPGLHLGSISERADIFLGQNRDGDLVLVEQRVQ